MRQKGILIHMIVRPHGMEDVPHLLDAQAADLFFEGAVFQVSRCRPACRNNLLPCRHFPLCFCPARILGFDSIHSNKVFLWGRPKTDILGRYFILFRGCSPAGMGLACPVINVYHSGVNGSRHWPRLSNNVLYFVSNCRPDIWRSDFDRQIKNPSFTLLVSKQSSKCCSSDCGTRHMTVSVAGSAIRVVMLCDMFALGRLQIIL